MSELPRLVVMVGLPRSGKSTVVRELYQPKGYAVVNPDSVRLALHGQAFVPSAEPLVWAVVELMVDALLLAGSRVVVDATNSTAKRREMWVRRGAKFHMLGTPAVKCIERARAGGNENLVPIIQRMSDAFECPKSDLIFLLEDDAPGSR